MKIIFVSFLKMFFRNRGAILGSIITPLAFLLIFGFVFGKQDAKIYKVGTYPIPSQKFLTVLKSLPTNVTTYKDIEELKRDIKKGHIDIGIYIKKKGFTFYYNKNDIKDVQVNKKVIGTIIAAYEKSLKKGIELFTIKTHTVKIGKIKGTSLGYLVPGIISLSILSLGMFSIIEVFSRYRKLGILKRLSVTPMNPFSFMLGVILGRLLIGLITAYFIYFLSEAIFNIKFETDLILFSVNILIAGISMSGLGAIIVLLFKETTTAANVASILFTIMIFFSGVYFPLTIIPKHIRIFSYIFPLTYVAQNMRYVMGVEYINYPFLIYSNLIMLGAGLLLLMIISKRYMGKVK